ncbi:MAG: AAA family ATPase [Gammaproteobacteria bacterium]
MTTEMSKAESITDAGYLQRFGLEREPFAATPDPLFFCADSMLTQRLDMLQNLTEFGMLLLLVLGESGVGKSSVLQQFLERASSNWQACELHADEVTNVHGLVENLVNGFQLVATDVSQLAAQLDRLRAQGQLAVLAVDDAQRLPEPALRALLDLSGAPSEDSKRLRLVLFGTEELQDKLAALSPEHADNTHVFTLPRLTELQTGAYIHHRLAVAGAMGEAPFTSAQVKAIYKASRGLPALINARAQQMLLDIYQVSGGARSGMRSAAAAMSSGPMRVALAVVGAVVLLTLATAMWTRHKAAPTEPTGAATEKTIELAVPDTDSTAGASAAAANPATPGKKPLPTSTPLPVPMLGPQVENPPISSPRGKIEVSALPAPETVTPPQIVQPHVVKPTPTPTVVSVSVKPVATITPLPSLSPAPTSMPIPPVVTAPTKTVAKAARSPAPSKPAAVREPTAHTAQPAGAYTLQLLGARREAALRQFIATNDLADKATVVHTQHAGQDWYVLLYGRYPSRAAASAGLTQLPPAVRAAHPWPRRVGEVQGGNSK